ncbi:TPA: primase-helicase family protein [Vibrio vulnificus]|uniref:primase-helicase family protein n=1 Tax=Vibrio parahaemolyticus TaxID=670 RepID=UPI0011686F0B|nr:primase-helicase family protein [Vibrio parahaemolyticus]TOA23222.1 hypothetical protein CGK32_16425 [Vibrio parahaemolyticus]HDY8038881.1 hypothetical protein [Vibrio vulnificus]
MEVITMLGMLLAQSQQHDNELREQIMKHGDTKLTAALNYARNRWAYVISDKKLIDTQSDDYELYKADDAIAIMASSGIFEASDVDEKAVIKALMSIDKGFMRIWDYEFRPDQKDMMWVDKGSRKWLNTFKPTVIGTETATSEELAMIDAFFEFVVPDEDERYQVLQWIAQAVLKPEQRNEFALMLYGQSNGTGKGTIQELLTRQMGYWNTFKPADSATWATGNFHDGVKSKRLLILDELYHDGYTVANKMKPFITEPKLYVQPKGKPWEEIGNYLNVLASSNNIQPLWLDESDRRWFCVRVEWANPNENKDHPDNIEQSTIVARFRHWLETCDRADAVIRHFLMGIVLDDWDVSKAPMTDAKRSLIKGSVSIAEDNFKHSYDYGDALVVQRGDVFKGHNVAVAKQKQWLEEVGYKAVEGRVSLNGIQARDWMITPKGVEVGMCPRMNGKELMSLLQAHHMDSCSPFHTPTARM